MKRSVLRAFALSAFWFLGTGLSLAEVPVVASIRPIASLVAGVMEGVGEPNTIVQAGASPHTYSMRPSDAQALQNAKVIFWVGPELEAFLAKPIDSLGTGATVITLSQAPGLQTLPMREGGAFEEHMHDEHGSDEHEHEGHAFDPHLWLDPENAKAMVDAIEAALVGADPKNAHAYTQNAKRLKDRLDGLTTDIAAELKPIRNRPFIVFHDGYQYFERRFGLHAVGSITVSPEHIPGAARVSAIEEKIKDSGAVCVFAEPQFRPSLIDVVIEGTDVRTGVLDPLGTDIAEGPDQYFGMIRDLAKGLKACLNAAS